MTAPAGDLTLRRRREFRLPALDSARFRNDLLVVALAGWVFGLIVWWNGTAGRLLPGDDLSAYLRAGHDLVLGAPVYVGQIGQAAAFSYAPPWAVAFAVLAWLPGPLLQLLMTAIDLLALRYIVGGWRLMGLAFFYPVTVGVIISGNIEILIAASLVLAARGRSAPLVVMAFAKLSPVLGLRRSSWRSLVVVAAAGFLVTLPWLHLWPEWIAYLLRQPSAVPGLNILGPWYLRLPFALGLLALRRPWASALAAVVAMPSMWRGTLVVLLAPIRLWLDASTHRRAARRLGGWVVMAKASTPLSPVPA